MTLIIIRRIGMALATLLALASALFLLQQLSPGDPVRAYVGQQASAEVVEKARAELGYDRPLPIRFLSYLGDLVRLDLQDSLRTKRPVAQDIAATLPATMELVLVTVVLAAIGALALGIAATMSGPVAKAVRLVMIVGASVPVFLVGLLGIVILYGQFGWLPGAGRIAVAETPTGPTGMIVLDSLLAGSPATALDALRHLILPAFALSLAPAVAIGRALGSSLQSVLGTDYVKSARMSGRGHVGIILRYALRNSLNSTLAMAGLQVGVIFASITLVELVFSWPGVGQYLALSVTASDLPAIIGVALVFGAIFIAVNTLVDIAQGAIDPRIRARAAARA